MSTTKRIWTKIHGGPRSDRDDAGMRFFTHATIEGIAVADNSGVLPDETEDGALWLDTERSMSVVRSGTVGLWVSCPVRERATHHTRGMACWCGISVADLRWLMENKHWPHEKIELCDGVLDAWAVTRLFLAATHEPEVG